MEFFYFLLALGALFGILHIPPLSDWKAFPTSRDRARLPLVVFFLLAGVLHFGDTGTFARMVPHWVPEHLHRPAVLISGVFEILGALGMAYRPTRRLAGYGLVALLIAVFPANIDMALHRVQIPGFPTEPVFYWARLPFQFLFMAWALWCAGGGAKKKAESVRRY